MSGHARGAVTAVVFSALLSAAAVVTGNAAAPPAPIALPPAVVYSPARLPGVRVLAARERPARRPRGRFDRARDGEPIEVELTAYCLRGTTRRGRYVRSGIVAADRRIFPLSRYVEVFVAGKYFGRFLVDDTGGLIKGPILDIWKPTCDEAVRFGRRKGVAVLVPRRNRG